MSVVFLNDEFVDADHAKISVFDRGFLLGDGVYEVIPAYDDVLFRLDEHLNRLQKSLDEIRLENPYSLSKWKTTLNELVKRNSKADLSIYLQVTRGVAVRDHAFPANAKPTVFAMANQLITASGEKAAQGVAAITLNDNRWSRCNVKAISLLPNVLLRQEAVDQGVVEAILIRDGEVTEGAASNVFAVINGEIITPPKSRHLLPGITRDLVVELAQIEQIPVAEKNITEAQLKAADEVWLTSSTKEIMPVVQLDSTPVGDGKPGEIWQKMSIIYGQFKQSLRSN